jgi:hypothetical protein
VGAEGNALGVVAVLSFGGRCNTMAGRAFILRVGAAQKKGGANCRQNFLYAIFGNFSVKILIFIQILYRM